MASVLTKGLVIFFISAIFLPDPTLSCLGGWWNPVPDIQFTPESRCLAPNSNFSVNWKPNSLHGSYTFVLTKGAIIGDDTDKKFKLGEKMDEDEGRKNEIEKRTGINEGPVTMNVQERGYYTLVITSKIKFNPFGQEGNSVTENIIVTNSLTECQDEKDEAKEGDPNALLGKGEQDEDKQMGEPNALEEEDKGKKSKKN